MRERHALSRHAILLSGLVVFTVLTTSTQAVAWAAAAGQPPAAGIVSTAFHAAATESGVPEELLLAIGYVNTHWRMEVSEDRGVGIMHLIHDPQSDTLTKATQLTGPLCPWQAFRSLPVPTSHSLTVWSQPAEARVPLSGAKARARIGPLWPVRLARSLPVLTSHSFSSPGRSWL